MKSEYYFKNKKYSEFLNNGKFEEFYVLVNFLKKRLKINDKYLDVGCGTGIVVDGLAKTGIDAYGVEVSQSSLRIAQRKIGKYKIYNGRTIPFNNSTFDAVGSFNVIEHVEDVPLFLKESKRVLKKDGYLLICTPNFMSITNSFHYRTTGIIRKIKNLFLYFQKTFSSKLTFDKFDPISRVDFHPDDDATNLTNPVDLLKWGKENKMRLVEYSGSIMPKGYISHYLGKIPLLNLFTGSVFIVFKK